MTLFRHDARLFPALAAAVCFSATPALSASALSLTPAQRHNLLKSIESQNTTVGEGQTEKADLKDSQPSVGAKVPNQLQLHVMPRDVVNDIPSIKGYEYAALKHQILIADPLSKQVVAVYPR